LTEQALPAKDPDRPLVTFGIPLAEKMILDATRTLINHLPSDTTRFLETLALARMRYAWTLDLNRDFTFWDCCKLTGRDPEDARDFMLSRLDEDMRKLIVGKRPFKCPVCSGVKS
jgi:hypothetical protein